MGASLPAALARGCWVRECGGVLRVVGCCRVCGAAGCCCSCRAMHQGLLLGVSSSRQLPAVLPSCIPASIEMLPVLRAGGTPAATTAHCLDAGISSFPSPSISTRDECSERGLRRGAESRLPYGSAVPRCPACPPPCSQHASEQTALRADGIHPPSARD